MFTYTDFILKHSRSAIRISKLEYIFTLLWCDTMHSFSSPTFRRNILPPSSRSENKSSNHQEVNRASCTWETRAGYLFCLFSDPEDRGSTMNFYRTSRRHILVTAVRTSDPIPYIDVSVPLKMKSVRFCTSCASSYSS
jgi:hypothetical protein